MKQCSKCKKRKDESKFGKTVRSISSTRRTAERRLGPSGIGGEYQRETNGDIWERHPEGQSQSCS